MLNLSMQWFTCSLLCDYDFVIFYLPLNYTNVTIVHLAVLFLLRFHSQLKTFYCLSLFPIKFSAELKSQMKVSALVTSK